MDIKIKQKTKIIMNKQDPKFIKDGMISYVNKVSNHHYATDKSDNRIIFYPYFKDARCIMFKVSIGTDDKIHIDSAYSSHKRDFKERLFLDRRPYEKIRSIKKYKRYANLFDGVKEYLDSQKDSDIFSYSFKTKILEKVKDVISK